MNRSKSYPLTPGTWKVIRVDGTEETIPGFARMSDVYRKIGCNCCDIAIIDRRPAIVMIADDTGMVDGKPINHTATYIYYSRYTTPYSIHGDVAILFDRDLA